MPDGGGSRPGDLSLPPGSPSAQPVLPRPGRKPLRSLRAAQVKDRRLQQLRNGIRRGLASRAGAAPPEPTPGPWQLQGPLSVRMGAQYHASHAGSRLRCPAPRGACVPPPRPLLPTCPGGGRSPGPGPAAAPRESPQIVPALLAQGALQSPPVLCVGAPGAGQPVFGAELPADTNKQRPGLLSQGGDRAWAAQSQGHLPAAQGEGSHCRVCVNKGFGAFAGLITGATNEAGGLGEGTTSLGRRIPRSAGPSHLGLF